MKKIITLIMLLCVLSGATCVYASDSGEMYSYTVTYVTGCDTEIEPAQVLSKTVNTTISITKTVPDRDGYLFEGWEYKDDEGKSLTLIYGDKLKINSSVELCALWRHENAKKLSYADGGRYILPGRIVLGETTVVSKTVPKKNGYIFRGWKRGTETELLMPGQETEIKNDTVLLPVWERGSLPELRLGAESTEDGRVSFFLDFAFGGQVGFGAYTVFAENLASGEIFAFDLGSGLVETDELAPGQYKAYISAEKYGIEYKSPSVNFVVHSGITSAENPLRLFVEGEELLFEMPPVLLDGHTYIALRHFCESLGASVDWTQETRCATITYNGSVVKVFENSNKCIVDGTTFELPAPTRLLSSTMFLPLRSVAELCNCEIVWDNSRKVYIYKEDTDELTENIVYISAKGGSYLAAGQDGLYTTSIPNFDCAWIFQPADAENGIYEIYNLNDLENPLTVKASEAFEGQEAVVDKKTDLDGHLWSVSSDGAGSFFVSPVSDERLFLDVDGMVLSVEAVELEIVPVYN